VNVIDPYERRVDRALPEQQATPPPSEDGTAGLAIHRDPSIPASAPPEGRSPRPGVAWVRPSELPTLLGSPVARRGIDLQSELVRRSRRAPIKATRAGRRITCAVLARPTQPSTTTTKTEDLGL
jgi:hypothetical protein